ncbi:MAG: 4-phospho-D-threonate 3-dehydrogenase / 4-phospho-D-erythronate 3-dehydrogenase [Candidatus Atribacteria bacterium]|nr:4-phospho-D-threonate 3-dehydrogenase / 4-phospho-D-erythronate 3-dehydrogenase [Candidatus Atribacteria bacterium]
MSFQLPVVAITMGDPAGIGPEIIIKALSEAILQERCVPLVVGNAKVIEEAARVAKKRVSVRVIEKPSEARDGQKEHVNVLNVCNVDFTKVTYGKVSAEAGRTAFECIKKAVELALKGEVDAIVTAPISKEALKIAGYTYSGHTEILATLTGSKDYAMMLLDDNMRVVHVTTHIPLCKVCDFITEDRVFAVIKLADCAMKALGIDRPRIGVAGVNPHAGEGGLFGREEMEKIAPAVDRAKKLNIDVEGPLPGDTIFAKLKGGKYDVVIAMYHDQGHIPIKTLGFTFKENQEGVVTRGVNVTLGLPIIRTSVDHGTAFDRAGKGISDPGSMIQAIEVAIQLVKGRLVEYYKLYE